MAKARRFGRPFRVALLLIASLLLAFLVLRSTGLAAVMERDIARAEALDPRDTRVELASALMLIHQQQGSPSPTGLAAAMKVAPDAPLALEPVLISGAAALAAGDRRRAEALLVEARLRDPRSALVRAHLLQLYATSGRVAEAAGELAVLARLRHDAAGELFVPQLAFYADDAVHRDAFASVLAAHPQVRNELLLHLISIGDGVGLIVRLAAKSEPHGERPDDEAWQTALVERLIRTGDIGAAHRLWSRFARTGSGDPQELVYNGSFRDGARRGPLGWELPQGGGGAAEIGGRSGLYVSYYGREAAELARQLLVLSPGRYRLEVEASGDVPAGRSALAWQVACLKPDIELLNLPLGEVASTARAVNGRFLIPKGCTGQSLRLAGVPLNASRTENIVIRRVRIRPLP